MGEEEGDSVTRVGVIIEVRRGCTDKIIEGKKEEEILKRRKYCKTWIG